MNSAAKSITLIYLLFELTLFNYQIGSTNGSVTLPPSEVTFIKKKFLRRKLMTKLNSMDENEIERQSKLIVDKLLIHPVYKSSKRISVYINMNKEVQTKGIIKNIFDSGKTCFIPKYTLNGLSMVLLNSVEEIESFPKSKWNTTQPRYGDIREDAIISGGLDLMILPGLGFTTNGVRLGRGKGFYDRILNEYYTKYNQKKLKTIGLAFSQQICDSIPVGRYDCLMDYVLFP